MTILITGANGFLGCALYERLANDGLVVRRATRKKNESINACNRISVEIDNLSIETDWSTSLKDVNQVVHLAARVHLVKDFCQNPSDEFQRVNVDGTINLAKQAAAAGVKRFIFLSSIKVNGESTKIGSPFTSEDVPSPYGHYAQSKFEAERLLWNLAFETGMEVVVIRPTVVYGPGVKANFLSLMNWLSKGLPLPLGAMTANLRSFVSLENLVDFISLCLFHPAAANQTFLVSDDHDISTADLCIRLSELLGRSPKQIAIPSAGLYWVSRLLNRPELFDRLCGSLQVDIQKTRIILGWAPPYSLEVGLRRTADAFLESSNKFRR